MARKAQVKLNSAGVESLLGAPGVRAVCREHAEAVAARARASAPVDTGAYRASIHVESDTTDRAVERVVASAPHAMLVEANTGNLARALGAE